MNPNKSMDKYKNKYRIRSTRAPFWNYGWPASYFVTICTHNQGFYFGYIEDHNLHLSTIGEIVQSEWLKTPILRPDMNLHLGEYIVMPNHFHGIITIGANDYNGCDGTCSDAMHCVTTWHCVSPWHCVSTCTIGNVHNRFGPQSKNLASIIRGFKVGVTIRGRKIDPSFAWQSRYHDHIIRNPQSYAIISTYIKKNPANWRFDRFNRRT